MTTDFTDLDAHWPELHALIAAHHPELIHARDAAKAALASR